MKKHYYLGIIFIILCGSVYGQNQFLPFNKNNRRSVDVLQSIKPSRILESTRIGYLRVSYTFPGAMLAEKTEKGDMYNFLHIDQFGKLGQVGAPALPMRNDMIAVSKNIKPSVELVDSEYIDYSGYNVYPALELPMDTEGVSSPKFEKDASVYEKDAFFPDNVVNIVSDQIMKDARMLRVQVCPVQFNPVTKTLRVYSKMVYQIYTGTDKTRVNTTTDDLNVLKRMILNPENVQQKTKSLQMDSEDDNTSKDYIIITHSMFDHAAKKLASWKASLGYKVEIVSKDSWTTDEVKETIHSRYNTWIPKPSYFVIIGDHEQVPSLDSKTPKNEDFVSDLYYSCMDGDDDYTPDIARGRISVASKEQSETVIDKIINYEKNPVDDADFYKKGLNCAQFQDVYSNENPDGYAARRFCHTSEDIRDYVIGQGYDVERIYYTDDANNPTHFDNGYFSNGEALPDELLRENGFNWNGGAAEITSSINDGRFYLFHRDHGYAGGSGWAHPEFVTSQIDGLHNGNKLPVVFSINCHTGEFSLPECFSEKFLRKENGGAVAVFGASYYSYSGPNDGFSLGLVEAIWPKPGMTPSFGSGAGVTNPVASGFENSVTSLGDVLNLGLMRMDQTWATDKSSRIYTYELFHLFGDPAMKMWTQAPQVLTADLPASVECGATSLIVSNISKQDALVTVVQGEKLLAKLNAVAGKAELNFAAVDNINELVVTISAPNYRPIFKAYSVSGCINKPLADFSISEKMIVLGEENQAIKFTDLSTYSPTSWLWDFGTVDIEFEEGTDENSQNPVVKFLTEGVYDIKLTATNENGNSEYIEEEVIKVYTSTLEASCFGQTDNLNNNYGMGIYAFSLNTINSLSGSAFNDGGYKDFTGTDFTTLVAGTTYKSKVTVGGVNPENIKVYLDSNSDGIFGDGEEIASIESFTGEKEFDFIVPHSSELDKMLRLRVISDYKSNVITDACYASTYGQTEDYAIVVKAGLGFVETMEFVERGLDFVKLKAKLISDGRGTVVEKGIVLAEHSLPTVLDTKVVDVDESAEEYVLHVDGLTEATSYSYRAYVINEFGISYGEEKSILTFSGEPNAHVTGFISGMSLSTRQSISWLDSQSTIKPWGYMLKWTKDVAADIVAPVDGVLEEANCIYIVAGEEATIVEGLDYESHYFYKIYPYTNEGASIDYYTAGDVPVIDANTLPFGEYRPITSDYKMNCITSFELNTINNTDVRPLDGYNDFTAISTDLRQGRAYDLTVSFNPGGSYKFFTAVWVDWNHDGWFDSETEVIDFGELVGKGILTKSLVVPDDAIMGKTTLRLVYEYNTEMPKPYGDISFFSAEDYSVNVDINAIVAGLWTGESSTIWEDVANWSEGKLPTETTNVLIQEGNTNYPVLSSVAHVKSIDIANGTSITIGEGSNLSVDNNIDIAGTFVLNAGEANISGVFNSIAGSQIDINGGVISMSNWGRDASSSWAKGTINLNAGTINVGTVKFSNSNVIGSMAEDFVLNVTGDLGLNYNGWGEHITGKINILAGKSEHNISSSASNADMIFKNLTVNTPEETVYLISDDQENTKNFTVTDKLDIIAGTVMCKNTNAVLSTFNVSELMIADGSSLDISSTSSFIKGNATGKGALVQTDGFLVLNAPVDQILDLNASLFNLSCEGDANSLVKNDMFVANKLSLVSNNLVFDACGLTLAKDCELLASGTKHIETINNAQVEKQFAGSITDQSFKLPIGYGDTSSLWFTSLNSAPSEDGSLFFSYENNQAEGVTAPLALNGNWKIDGDDIMKAIPVDIVCSTNGFDLSAETYFWAYKTNVWNTISVAELTKPFSFSLDSPVAIITAMTKGDAPSVSLSDPSGNPADVIGVDESMEYLYNSTDWEDCYLDMTIDLNGNNTFKVRKKATGSVIESLATENLDTNSNEAPVANAGVAQIVNEGDLVTLDGKASSDADKQDLTFAWISKEAIVLTGADTSTPSFTAPSVVADKDYIFELTVSDGDLTSTSSVVITVKNVNIAPVANAGVAQTVNAGDVVILDGSVSSDVDANTRLTYLWTSEDGISIENNTQVQASFIAPEPDIDTEFEIQLAVSDGIDVSKIIVIITVKAKVVTGIENIDAISQIVSLYPNPCQASFKIHLNECPQVEGIVEIYDVTGRLVYQASLFEQEKVISHPFVSGLYLVHIRIGDMHTVKKLIVK